MMELLLEEWQSLVITSIFIIFFLLDIWKARSNIAHWIPGKTVMLGLTIHMVHMIGFFTSDVQLTANKLKIYGARLSLYVFAGCLLPGMAEPGSISRYFNIATIFGSLGFHVFMEIKKNYFVWKENDWRWCIVYHGVLTASTVFLFLFLTLVVLAGQAIRERLRITIPIILSQYDENENVPEDVWESFEVEVLKTRIIARACQPEYVLARSLCSTIAAFIAFICDVVFVFKVVSLKSALEDDDNGGDDEGNLSTLIFWFQCIFIAIGSAVIFYRWLMSVFYFSTSAWKRARNFIFVETIASDARVCELISRLHPMIWYISRQLLAMYIKLSLGIPSSTLRTMLWGTITFLSATLLLVPYLVFFLIILTGLVLTVVVSLMIRLLLYISILCWYLSSLLVFRSRVLGQCLFGVDMSIWQSVTEESEFVRYKQALEKVCMPGEVPASLWIADGSSINQTRLSFHEAYQRGQSYTELIELTTKSVDAKQGPGKYVYMLEEIRSMIFKGYILGMREPIWKITAYAIVRVIKEVRKAVGEQEDDFVSNAYCQARDLLDFVDNPEEAVQDPVYLLAGNHTVEEFAFLKAVSNAPISEMIFPNPKKSPLKWLYENCKSKMLPKKFVQGMKPLVSPETIKLKAALKSIWMMFDKAKEVLTKEHILGECPQAKAGYSDRSIQPNYSLYMVCRLILDNNNYNNVRELLDELECFFGDVITSCLLELPDVVVKCCRQWAANFKEEKIVKAIDIAGTARGVMQKSGLQLRRTWQLRDPPPEWTVNLTALQSEEAEGSDHDTSECSEITSDR